MAKVSKEKKLIRAPDDLVVMLNEEAARQGKTFYRYVTEIFEQAVRANGMKRSLKEIIDSYEMMEIYREAGSVTVPHDFIEYLVDKVYTQDRDSLHRIWHQMGKWCGLYLKGKFNDDVEAFARFLKRGLWEVNEVELKRNENSVELRCISTSISQERTLFIQEFIEGALNSLGLKKVESESFRGIIILKFSI